MTRHNLAASVFFLCMLASAAEAASLVNINTADSATLQTLSGIGPSKAQAIIDYRTQHGPFAAIADIQNVSGIGPTTYNNIKNFITVDSSASQNQPAPAAGAGDQTQTPSAQDSAAATTSDPAPTLTQVQSAGGVSPPPLTARITTDAAAVVGAGTSFDGAAFSAAGQPLTGARYLWNFGDGATAEGAHVLHTYAYPGTYDVALSVAYNYSSATTRVALPALEANVSLVAEGDGSLTLYDLAGTELDVSWWRIGQGTSTFMLPEGTAILAGKGVRFSPSALRFAGDQTAALYYPNGALAASAKVGANSPLRGTVVEMAPSRPAAARPAPATASATSPAKVAKPAAPASATSTYNSNDQVAAAGLAPFGVEWSYLVGLLAVIAIGAVGTYYAHPAAVRREETYGEADEFEIEE